VGPGVQGWVLGQRVGVGFLAGFCGYCEFCRNGDLVNCRNQEYTGIHHDGGYAEAMIAKASGLVSIPDDLSSADAAPLLCAGLTTFSALRNSPAKAGDLVAVLGIGGLGHLAVQYARHMGFEVVAIARGTDASELAKKLGAHHSPRAAALTTRRTDQSTRFCLCFPAFPIPAPAAEVAGVKRRRVRVACVKLRQALSKAGAVWNWIRVQVRLYCR
jgi:D-arabinose 1-dehydrogenase-like Zn-dependent alcohol dehydrogenase